MDPSEVTMRQRLWAVFHPEAREHLAALSGHLLDLEKEKDGKVVAQLIEAAFREAHSLKGAARSVNFAGLESLCQAAEEIFSNLKKRAGTPSPALIDALIGAVRLGDGLLTAEVAGTPPPPIAATLGALRQAAGESVLPVVLPAPAASPASAATGSEARSENTLHLFEATAVSANSAPETVRVATVMLDSVRNQAEEFLSDKLASAARATELASFGLTLAEWSKRWSSAKRDLEILCRHGEGGASVASEHVRGFLDWNDEFFAGLEDRTRQAAQTTDRDHRALATRVDALLDGTRRLLMLGSDWLLDGLRQPVRDLARDLGKDIRFLTEGGDIELDRRILAELKVPFLHLLRNSVDHGIEFPSERRAAGKTAPATLTIEISPPRDGGVEISLADNGRGFDTAKLRSAAVQAGTLSAEQAARLTETEAQELAFGSGISTRSSVTELSGRGLGLAIVREKVEQLGGRIRLESVAGQGTTFHFFLPLSLATFRGVVVRVGDQFFVCHDFGVERAMRVAATEIITLENHEVLSRGGEQIALARLARLLGITAGPEAQAGPYPAVLLVARGQRLAVLVDEVCGEQEIVAKKLGAGCSGLPHLAGAAVLGNGEAALVLEIEEIIRTALSQAPAPASRLPQPEQSRKRILVTDDSITSRTLLHNILESAGYVVETAVDGIDAFTRLRRTPFDLVLSDVDMPRLHGVGLTEKIRADPSLAAVPIILITSLDSPEDRERGLEAGANAYLVKRSFEESNLLDTVRSLL